MYADSYQETLLNADISINSCCVTAQNLVLYYLPNCVILNCLHTVTTSKVRSARNCSRLRKKTVQNRLQPLIDHVV